MTSIEDPHNDANTSSSQYYREDDGYEPPASTEAIASLVCGICGLMVAGCILGPIAIHCGHVAREKIEDHPERYGGETIANIGILLGWISVFLFILQLVVVILMMTTAAATFEGFQSF